MGGWLVPTYQPDGYARTLCNPLPPVATPVIDCLRVTTRSIEADATWYAGAGRHTAIVTLLHRLHGDLGAALAPDGNVTAHLRPFLEVRILGVISLRQMSGHHAIACLAKLAQLSHPAWNLRDWCATTPPKEQHDHPRPRPADHAGR